MDSQTIEWKQIREKAGPFSPEAYQFVREGLAHTVKMIHGREAMDELEVTGDERHVDGRQLCMGLRDFALTQYGMLARTVLNRWGVQRTDDFGRIVFAMIEAGFMRQSDEDVFEDFQGVYDFTEAFSVDMNN